ncbi:Uncharacterized protein APZ42_031234 [Daphnia magna]|uniref:Uncharacterized protein n=1 Tax=Daphnia magna TaxID=35525 RepID=A0A0P4ZXT1_9CRUS|nr:Uncharacterized protein APZ42_031234 [Daphnia magna]
MTEIVCVPRPHCYRLTQYPPALLAPLKETCIIVLSDEERKVLFLQQLDKRRRCKRSRSHNLLPGLCSLCVCVCVCVCERRRRQCLLEPGHQLIEYNNAASVDVIIDSVRKN